MAIKARFVGASKCVAIALVAMILSMSPAAAIDPEQCTSVEFLVTKILRTKMRGNMAAISAALQDLTEKFMTATKPEEEAEVLQTIAKKFRCLGSGFEQALRRWKAAKTAGFLTTATAKDLAMQWWTGIILRAEADISTYVRTYGAPSTEKICQRCSTPLVKGALKPVVKKLAVPLAFALGLAASRVFGATDEALRCTALGSEDIIEVDYEGAQQEFICSSLKKVKEFNCPSQSKDLTSCFACCQVEIPSEYWTPQAVKVCNEDCSNAFRSTRYCSNKNREKVVLKDQANGMYQGECDNN